MKRRHKTSKKLKRSNKSKSRKHRSGSRFKAHGSGTAKRHSRWKHRRPSNSRHSHQAAAAGQELRQADSPHRETGVNIIGFINAEIGIGESSQIAAKALNTAAIPFGILNFPLAVTTRMSDYSWSHKVLDKARYRKRRIHRQ